MEIGLKVTFEKFKSLLSELPFPLDHRDRNGRSLIMNLVSGKAVKIEKKVKFLLNFPKHLGYLDY